MAEGGFYFTASSDDQFGFYKNRTNSEDFITRNAATIRIATITAITVGCLLVFASLAALFLRLCLPYCRELANRRWRQRDKSGTNDYEQIDDDAESQTSSGKSHDLESAFGSAVQTTKMPALQIDTSPILRIHPVGSGKGIFTHCTPTGGRSPVVTRSLHHGNIPFELPPIAPPRTTTTLQIQPEVGSCRSPSRSSIGSRSSLGSRNNLSADEMGGESEWDEKNKGSKADVRSLSPCISPKLSNSPQIHSPELFRNNMLGKIQPELYRYSERGEQDLPPSRCGRVWFSLFYDGAIESLTVRVIKVKQLPSRGHNDASRDSFVKLFLLPDERISQQTKVKQRTNNPLFNETFVFQVSDSEIKNRCLRLSVYDVDKRKTRHLLGHALVSLTDLDPSKADEVTWRDLDDIAHPGDTGNSLGELNISLSYNPALDRLTVVILEAKNLRQMDLEETVISVRVALTQGHKTVKTKKTVAHEGVSDPQYHESFSFKVTAKDMEQTWLAINVVTSCGNGALHQLSTSIRNVMSGGRHRADHKYGRLAIGSFMYCRGEQLLHWQEMMAHPRKTITKWHSLSEVPLNQ